jgi:RNA polymerase sigma-70 factor, ECF subfamily
VAASESSELVRVDDVPVVRGVESFDAFFRREYRDVLGLAVVLTRNRAVAEELTQEAFLATFRHWERVAPLDSPGAWVRRVVSNRSVSTFRRSAAEARALLRLNSYASRSTATELGDGMEVWREVRRLPRRQAQVVALTYFADLPRREVAEIVGCSEETVKTHLERARRTLAGRLMDLGEDRHGR